jgi:transposase
MWTKGNRPRYDRSKLRYPSDLTDAEWALVAPLIPPATRGGNKRTVNGRAVVQGLLYILSTGCQWRAIPKDLPPRSTLHKYCRRWESRHNAAAKAMDYMLKRWDAFTRFLGDGRICLTNNATERALRGIATARSLCPSFSSVWKDWKFVLPVDATRTASCRQGLGHARVLQIGSADLPGSIRDNLLGRQNAVLDETPDSVRGDA